MRVSAANSDATPAIELDASEHPIKSVTVFSSCKAEVVRTFAVELEVRTSIMLVTLVHSSLFDAYYITDNHRRVKTRSTSLPFLLASTLILHA